MHISLAIQDLSAWCGRHGAPYYSIVSEDVIFTTHRKIESRWNRSPVELVAYGRSRVFCGRLHNVCLVGTNAAFVTDDQVLICHGITHRDYDVWYHLQRELVTAGETSCVLDLEPPQTVITEECVYLGGSPNYGHFQFEYLSRLAVIANIRRCRELRLIVYDDTPERFLEFLLLAGYPRERLAFIPRGKAVKFHQIWLPSCPFYRDKSQRAHVYPPAYHYLRWAMSAGLRFVRPGPRSRIYYTRQGAGHRRCVNEPEVRALLESRGFHVTDPAELPPREQLEMVSNAEIIVGTIGAATAMTLFAPEDCAIIELLPSRDIAGIYNSIGPAHWLGQPYRRIIGKRVRLGDNDRESPLYHDFEVDLEEVGRVVDLAIEVISI
jgi:hypothetical protein